MGVVKDPIRILSIGLVIEEAHHEYSKDVHIYTSVELFEHLVKTEIPLYVDLKRKGEFPTVAPLKLPCPPNVAILVTMSELVNYLYKQTDIDQLSLIKGVQDERDGR